MAKRTPRSEAEDTTTTGAPTRQQAPPPSQAPSGTERRSRERSERSAADERAQETAPEASDTFAARPGAAEANAPDDRSASMSSEEQGGEPTEEEIRYRAYLLYIERGAGDGMDFEDWVRAERELRNRR